MVMQTFTSNRNGQAALSRIEAKQKNNAVALEREVCATFARGNISLQQGRYITQKDMDDLQSELVDYFLKDRK